MIDFGIKIQDIWVEEPGKSDHFEIEFNGLVDRSWLEGIISKALFEDYPTMESKPKEVIKYKSLLAPLYGKYYNTEIDVMDNSGIEYEIKIRSMQDSPLEVPSSREWDQLDPEIAKKWGENPNLQDFGSPHYETECTYQLALRIVELLNSGLEELVK